MVCIITGPAESGRNTAGKLLAEALGWEFFEAENLPPSYNQAAGRHDAPRTDTDSTFSTGMLSTAISFWLYEWRDAVVSSPVLTEKDRRQLSKSSSLVKIVRLQAAHTIDGTAVTTVTGRDETSKLPAGWPAEHDAGHDVFTVESSQHVGKIVAEITSALIRGPSLRAG